MIIKGKHKTVKQLNNVPSPWSPLALDAAKVKGRFDPFDYRSLTPFRERSFTASSKVKSRPAPFDL